MAVAEAQRGGLEQELARRQADRRGDEHCELAQVEAPGPGRTAAGPALAGCPRVGQMLDDVEEDDGILRAKRLESRFAQQAADDVQAEIASMGSSRLRRLDAAHLKSGAAGFIEKEAVGATDLEQAALWLAVLDELDRAGELAP